MRFKGRFEPYAVCLANPSGGRNVVVSKSYTLLPDLALERRGLVRIIDETGSPNSYPLGEFALMQRAPTCSAKEVGQRGSLPVCLITGEDEE